MSERQESCIVNGIELRVRYVPGGAPCIVFVSGLGGPGEEWDGVLERLPAGLSTFVYDRAGCGSSGPVDAATAADEAQPIQWGAEQLFELLNKAGVPAPWVLVGHSIGGLIVDAFARLWPDLISGLVLVDASDPLLHTALDEDKPVLVDGREGEVWCISYPPTLENFEPGPQQHIETVVIGSAIWRVLPVKEREKYRPLSLIEMDHRCAISCWRSGGPAIWWYRISRVTLCTRTHRSSWPSRPECGRGQGRCGAAGPGCRTSQRRDGPGERGGRRIHRMERDGASNR
ncbi:alpha/beta fold hydrolase [Kribbella qitaiheensis]|uniref:alpha/beta fold hydrolase n=1 Tax=Kribbella qitaiheensis TaxID=1544730 RepID=UPI001628BA2C|nr:alpha/beta hydrolase [Kribbella qitaiheensis]